MREIEICPTKSELTRVAAERFVVLSEWAIEARGRFAVALSGGSTPRSLYELLAVQPFTSQVDWTHVHVFWGDERAVPPDHSDSNFRMTEESLLRSVPLLPENIHRIRAELPPEEAALDYEQRLGAFFTGQRGQPDATTLGTDFDLILLGMGGDGHTASLFPGTAVLCEQKRWVVAYYVDKLDAWRITLTPASINAAKQVLFLVSGGEKAETLQRVLTGPYQPDVLPAQVVQPENGDVTWLLDAEAAASL
jgi:6-phosphogluconolactonase